MVVPALVRSAVCPLGSGTGTAAPGGGPLGRTPRTQRLSRTRPPASRPAPFEPAAQRHRNGCSLTNRAYRRRSTASGTPARRGDREPHLPAPSVARTPLLLVCRPPRSPARPSDTAARPPPRAPPPWDSGHRKPRECAPRRAPWATRRARATVPASRRHRERAATAGQKGGERPWCRHLRHGPPRTAGPEGPDRRALVVPFRSRPTPRRRPWWRAEPFGGHSGWTAPTATPRRTP